MAATSILDPNRRPSAVAVPSTGECIAVGSTVALQFTDGATEKITIGQKRDLAAGVISLAAPLARAILGARVGDQRTFQAQGLTMQVTILQVTNGKA